MKETFGTNRVVLFHHFTRIGGTVYDRETSYGIIQGTRKAMSLNMTPDTTILFEDPTGAAAQIPTQTSLVGVSSEAEFDALTVGATTTYKARNFIPVVPFLLEIVSDTVATENGAAKKVFLAVVEAIKKFDTDNAGKAEFQDKAKQKCKDCLAWLYLVASGSNAVTPTPTTGCNNIGIITKLNGITRACVGRNRLSPVRTAVAPAMQLQFQKPLELIAASTSSNQDFLRKLTQIQEANKDASSKSFQKIPEKYRNMILVASSTTETTLVEINDKAKEFFKSSSTLNANIFLNSYLETDQIECSISSALTTNLLHGSFLWVNAVTPSGLASSVITSEDCFRSDALYEGMVLDYSTKFEMSHKSLEKLTRSKIRFPTDLEGTLERIRALTALCQLFFGRRSFPAQGLKQLTTKCLDNKRMLKANCCLDKQFIAQFLCSIDNRLYQWLQECSMAVSVEDTNLRLIEYSTLFDDIAMNRFQYRLPPSVKEVSEGTNSLTDKIAEREKKRQRTVEHIRNEAVPGEWKLKQGERWDSTFRNKTMAGPELSCGSKFCLKFWVKGVCYKDCKQIASHAALSEEDKALGDAYIKELRGD